MGTIEYRKLFRADVLMEIEYRTRESVPVSGLFLSSNLSSSGVCVIGNQKLDINTELDVSFRIGEQGRVIKATAKIIWQKQCQFVPASQHVYFSYGIRFIDMAPEDAVLTSDFIYELVRSSHEMEEKEIIQRFEQLQQSR